MIFAFSGQKPVQCTLCQRRFKNIPALNGHMRLHGGYFKKVSVLVMCIVFFPLPIVLLTIIDIHIQKVLFRHIAMKKIEIHY